MRKLIINVLSICVYTALFANQKSINQQFYFTAQFIKPRSLVFDVGAHTGSKTDIYLLHQARVVCIEPQPSCVKILQQKYQNNPLVSVVPKGLSDIAGNMTLHICSKSPLISTFSKEWQHGRFEHEVWDKKVTVSITTLDELINTFGVPYYCKIDVEGFEGHVLKGLSQPIPFISFEFTKEFFKNSKVCIQHLMALGYSSFNYALGETPHFVHTKWISHHQLIQEIEDNPDPLLWGDIYVHYDEVS